ncbi:sensor histidine kinase KdpD [Rhodococcus sp. PAMC28707]|uniref:sensor histidine kinase n=1 Tax=unclassified Rhodococcus (in: high G+C Gram-positive bacteria) TaxID=192944 RepID=UPI00109DEE70|nr:MULTISPECIES: sensor histidine kinase KdpD [unclassified Rhodococcus (in: high G+C Gram-positive bacteria)]QCB49717.1 sensor histidine kinase KdpD [Rhodococcus sp. PAMC28705]QCB58591.1 sensor histidine kinase KdpD [Rhodococcus sp. PAMC28707]
MSNTAGRRGSVGPDRGDLRIYLGAAPGVGKTFAMLGEAHRRQERGCDVVAGVVETHGRARTAGLLEGIEQIPLRSIQYRGSTAHELDVAAIIERNPSLVLVDELAHTNTPGSTHEKRWQDVEELLDAGIDVVSTLNVQHLESLNDVVEQITGVPQRETVPDSVVRGAEQIELVDVAPEALRRRLSHGNIYAAEKVDAALSNYFRQGNLTALRELSLLWIADQVDAALTKYRSSHDITDTWETRERVVVSVTGGPESETLLRRASRIASKSSAELMVLHVIRGDGMAGVSAPQMGKVRKLAASLGASMHSVVGDDVPSTLLEFARGANATQLVIGTSRRSRWARIMDAGIGATVIQHSGKIDVHMVTHAEISRGWRIKRLVPTQRRILSWAAAVIVPFLSALTMLLVDPYLDLGGESALFFMVVLGVALLGGVAPAALSALIAGLLLNYFFADPRHSFTIAEPDNFVTTIVLLMMAVAVAFLVDSAARRTVQARRASQEAELLTLFAGTVLRGGDIRTLLERVRETYSQRAVSIIRAEGSVVESVGEDPPAEPDDADTAIETADGTFTLLLSGSKTGAHDRRVLSAVANQAMGLIRQSELALEASKAAGLAEADRLRRALLSAVSHDLRTPLAAVKASVSSLRSTDVEFSPEDTAELLTTIEESTDQLTGLVGNLLDSSRLAAGVITPSSTVVYIEDSVSAALASSAAAGSLDRVIVDVDDVAVAADAGLLERVLANLIDNALRHAPGTPVRVGATYAGSRALITVSDSGPGIARGTEEAVFEAFQRLGDSDNTTGVGLGLSVVRGFVEAMKGAVTISETAGGGVTMTVELASAASLTNNAVAHHITDAAARG